MNQKTTLAIMIFALLVTSLAIQFPLFQASAAIYGADSRRDVREIAHLRGAASAVAIAVGNSLMSPNSDGTTRIEIFDTLGNFVCPGERFIDQPSMGVCSGFLIGDRYLVTAGHCLLPKGVVDNKVHPFCKDFDWIFDYNVDRDGQTFVDAVPENKRYACKRVIRAETIERLSPERPDVPGHDFALLELDRPVQGARPLKIAQTPLSPRAPVFTIGHPTGLPAKYSGFSNVSKNIERHFFEVNLDTQGGNSGGPVFNHRNQVVGILVAGHSTDYIRDHKLDCLRPNTCDRNGHNCKSAKGQVEVDTANLVQKLGPLLQYIPLLQD